MNTMQLKDENLVNVVGGVIGRTHGAIYEDVVADGSVFVALNLVGGDTQDGTAAFPQGDVLVANDQVLVIKTSSAII